METPVRVSLAIALALSGSAAFAAARAPKTMPFQGRNYASAGGESAGLAAPETLGRGQLGGSLGASPLAIPSGGSSDQDTSDMDPLQGAPSDYENRYSLSTSSGLENRASGLDGGAVTRSPSQPASLTNTRMSSAKEATLKRPPSVTQTGNLLTPAWGVDVHHSPW